MYNSHVTAVFICFPDSRSLFRAIHGSRETPSRPWTFQKFKPVAHVTEVGDWQAGERDRLHDRTFRRIRACFNVSSQRVLVQMRNFAILPKK